MLLVMNTNTNNNIQKLYSYTVIHLYIYIKKLIFYNKIKFNIYSRYIINHGKETTIN